jgi:hypothetical protein
MDESDMEEEGKDREGEEWGIGYTATRNPKASRAK